MLETIDTEIKTLRAHRASILDARKQYARLLKDKSKKRQSKGGNATKSGIVALGPVPPPLAKLFKLKKDAQMARTDVTHQVHTYLKENELVSDKKTREYNTTPELRDALMLKKGETLTFYNIQTMLSRVYDKYFPKNTDKAASAPASKKSKKATSADEEEDDAEDDAEDEEADEEEPAPKKKSTKKKN
jgi:hypothetical protein